MVHPFEGTVVIQSEGKNIVKFRTITTQRRVEKAEYKAEASTYLVFPVIADKSTLFATKLCNRQSAFVDLFSLVALASMLSHKTIQF
jgi:hypothetical protein